MIRRRVTMRTERTASGAVGLGLGGRLRASASAMRCCAAPAVRGEDPETLSRALGVTAATLTEWQDTFLSAGEASLAARPTDGEALKTERLKAKLGEMLLKRELLEAKIAALEANRPWPAGGRGDEPDPLALKRQALWSGPCLPGLARLAGQRLSASLLLPARTATAPWPGWADAGCRAGRRD